MEPSNSKNEPAECGPGCDCATPSKGSTKALKVIVSVAIILVVGAIFAYKASTTQENPSAKSSSAFALGQVSTNAQPNTGSQPASVAKQIIGEYLESLNALNQVAMNEDAVFVFIPAKSDEPASKNTNDAVLAAQQTLMRNNVTLGLFTLPTSAPDYAAVSAQVQSPAVLVAVKGKGMSVVSGDVTETKLLQAFTASSSAGGCGPSGCGPSSAACP